MIGSLRNHSQMTSEIKANRRGDRQGRDEMRAEPIVFLPLVQNHLQRTHSQRQHRYSNVVHPDTAAL